MSSQWRWTGGMESHRVGLDYGTWKLHLRKIGVRKRDRIAVFAGVQVMEHAALDAWGKQQSKKP